MNINKEKADWIFKGITIGIPFGVLILAIVLSSAGLAIPLLVIGWLGWIAVRSWNKRNN